MRDSVQLRLALDEPTKRCTGCSDLKPLEAFWPRSDKPHLRQSKCKQCTAVVAKQRQQANKVTGKRYNEATEQRICQHCGKSFAFKVAFGKHDPAKNPGKYCSRACACAALSSVLNRTCKQCGVRYHAPRTAKTMFCGRECSDAWKMARQHICGVCDTPFYDSRPAARYCSRKCADAGRHTWSRRPFTDDQRCATYEWKQIRKAVLERDGNQCTTCGSTRRRLAAHHIIPWRVSHDDSLTNLIILCSVCHRKADAEYTARFG